MPTEIDSLQIRIETEAKSAGDGISKLEKSLGKLKTAMNGVGNITGSLVNLANSAHTAGEAVGDSPEKLNRLSEALKALSKLGKVTLSPTLGPAIGDIAVAAGSMKAGFDQKMVGLANALEALNKVKDVKISPTIATEIQNIGTALNSMSPGNMAKAPQVADAIGAFASVSGIKIPDKLADTLMNIGAASELLQGADFTPLTTLAAALTPLSQLGTIRINASLADTLFNLASAADILDDVDLTSFSTLATALEPLSRIGNIHLGSVFNQLERMPKVFDALKSVDMDAFADAIQRLNDALTPLVTNLQGVQSGLRGLAPTISNTAQSMEKMGTASKKTSSGVGGMGVSFIGAYAIGKRLASVLAGWINQSNRYIENLNLFTVAMGEYAGEAQAYAEKVGELMGIDPSDWMRNQGVFMTLSTGFGVAGDRAAYMSQQLTQLGYDLSSFFNIAVEGEGGAMQKLQAGLAGELEPLRRLGFDLSEAKLKATAATLGIKETFNTMSQAEKAQLRYYAIMTQVTTAHGDLARTINTPANQLRILQAQVQQCARAFGNIFIPALNAVLPVAIAVAKALRIVASAIASLFGFTLPDVDYSNITKGIDDVAGGLSDVQDNANGAGSAVKKLKSYLMGFDELNVIEPPQENSGGGGGGGGSGNNTSQWDWDLPGYDFLAGLIDSTVDTWMAKFQPAIDWLTNHLEVVGGLIAAIGGGLLLWKFADTFLPNVQQAHDLLATIGSVITGGAVATVTVALSYYLTNDFLSNSDYSSLIASGLTSVLGSAITGAIIAKGTGNGKYGMAAAGITLAISGIANVTLTLGNILKNGITKDNLISLAWEGVKAAVGVGMLVSSLTGSKNWAFGAGGLTFGIIATAGLILGAAAEVEKEKNLTANAILLVGGAAAAFATSMTTAAKQFGWEKVSGKWTFAVAASAGLAIAAGTAVMTSGKATAEALMAQAVSAFAAAVAATDIAKKYGIGKDPLLMGTGAFFLSLGAQLTVDSMAIKKSEGFTSDAIALDALAIVSDMFGGAAIAAGLGFSLSTGAILGLAAGLALTAIATVAALSASTSTDLYTADYGDLTATTEELQRYFDDLFKFNVTAKAAVIEGAITEWDAGAEELNKQIAAFEASINKVLIGAELDPLDIENLEVQLFGESGIVANLKAQMKEGKEVIELGISLVPPKDSTGADMDPAAILNAYNLSTSALGGAMDDLGAQLSNLLAKSVKDGLDEQETTMVANLVNWISNIQKALQQGQLSGEMTTAIQLSLAELDEDSFKRAVEVYKTYKNQVTESLTEIELKTRSILEGQKAALEATIQTYEDSQQEVPTAIREALAAIDAAIGDLDPAASIKAATADAIDPAKQEMIAAFQKIFNGSLEMINPLIEHYQLYNGEMFTTMLQNQDTENAKTELTNMIDQVLRAAFGENYDYAMDVAGLLDLTGWDLLGKEMQTQIYNTVRDNLGPAAAQQLFKDLNLDMSNVIHPSIGITLTKDGWTDITTWANDAKQKGTGSVWQNVAVAMVDGTNAKISTITAWLNKDAQKGTGTVAKDVTPKLDTGDKKAKSISEWMMLAPQLGETVVEKVITPTIKEKISDWLTKKNQMGTKAVTKDVGLKVAAGKDGTLTTVSAYVATKMGKTAVNQGVGLAQKGWTKVSTYVAGIENGSVYQPIKLNKGWTQNTVADYVEDNYGVGTLQMPVEIVKKPGNSVTWTFKQGGDAIQPKYMLYGRGGFPETGQAFIAREAGPELVGTIGRRSAVANNDQIVESVSGGVREANSDVVSAIWTLINVVEGIDPNITITDDDIGRAADRYRRKRGASVNSGAFANSY